MRECEASNILGRLVRFVHQPDGPAYMVVAMKGDGSAVEIMGLPGWFAPHLFVVVEEPAEGPAHAPDGAGASNNKESSSS